MNLLRYVSQYVWGSSSSSDLIRVSGSFYDHYLGQWRCLFNDCHATVSRGEIPHHFILIVEKIKEEDKVENENEEDEDDSTERFEFSLDDEMDFANDAGPMDHIAFSWWDGDYGKRFLFEFEEGDVVKMADLFKETVCQCIFESKYKITAESAKKQDVLSICKATPTPAKMKRAGSTPTKTKTPEKTSTPVSTPSRLYPTLSTSNSPYTPQSTNSSVLESSSFSTPISTGKGKNSTPLTPITPITPISPPKASSSSSSSISPPPALPKELIRGNPIISVPAALYMFSESKQTYQLTEQNVKAVLSDTSDKSMMRYTFFIVAGDNSVITSAEVSSEIFARFSAENHALMWIQTYIDRTWNWSLMFPDSETEHSFKEAFAKALYEFNNQEPFKGKGDEREYLVNALTDELPIDPNTSYDEVDALNENDLLDFAELSIKDENEKEYESKKFTSSGWRARTEKEKEEEEEEEDEEEEEESEEEEDVIQDGENSSEGKSKETNRSLAVGVKHNRAFVTRGSQIGVFKTTADDRLEYSTTIKGLATPKGDKFSPSKVMLHEQDAQMVMLNPKERNKLFVLDLNRGDVVQEWRTSEYHGVNDILPQTKYAQTTPAKTLVGMNDRGFFLLDPRLPGDKIVDSNAYFYSASSRPSLKCAATTGTGQLVVGNNKGEVRLFDRKLFGEGKSRRGDSFEDKAPRAKTSLPGFGDPIVGIDVTEDGTWILATCKTYLMVIPAKLPGGTTGFEKSMGQQKPVPRRLQLKPEDIRKMGGKVSFTAARFNTTTQSGVQDERSIVTSSGEYLISWNFRKVKQNILDEYQIKKYDSVIVADQFKFGEDRNIIVTMPNDVVMAKKIPVLTPRKVV